MSRLIGRRAILVAGVGGALAVGAGIAGARPQVSTTDPRLDGKPQPRTTPSPVAVAGSVEGQSLFPYETLEDWVSYCDLVVPALATSIRREEPTSDERTAGEGLAVRFVTLDLAEALWAAPRARPWPKSLDVPSGGWVFGVDRPERRLRVADSVDYWVGHQYLLPLTYDESVGLPWQPIYASAVLPFDDNVVGRGEPLLDADGKPIDGSRSKIPARSRLWGMAMDQVRELLASTRPNPIAEKYSELPPLQRYSKVQEAARQSG